jgi:hypothetical protein
MVKKDFDYYDYPFKKKLIDKWRKNLNKKISSNILAGFYYKYKKSHGKDVEIFLEEITSPISTSQVVREFSDMILFSAGTKSDENGYLSSYQVYQLVEFLFKYFNQKNGLTNRKHFAPADLKTLNV